MMLRQINKLSREVGSNEAFLKKQKKFFKKENRIQEVIAKPTPRFDKLAVIVDRMREPGGENN
jgi:hypothetical protein